ncbi:sugar transporter domain-containing protein [Phthorimaea operculella]|nr:sugar transporter domain-containing protein [Phthorimaea operculella]
MLVGMLTGSLLYGYISDRFGRKVAVLVAIFTQPLFGTINAFASGYWSFTVFRFLAGNALGGTYVSCYVLLMELSGKSFRPYLCGLHEIAPSLSVILLPVIAYFLRDWRHLQLATAAPWFVVIVYYWILPESPRWLITVGRKKEAIEILTYIAKKNNRPTDNIVTLVNIIDKETKCENSDRHGSYMDLFKTPKIRKYTIVNGLMWMCCAHAYFGATQYIGRLNGNLYLNVLITGVMYIPALMLMNPEYDTSTIVSSVTSEFNLICKSTSLASLAQSMLQVGILAGSIFYGYVSDKYGRKIAAVSAMFFTGFFGTTAALSPTLWLFIVSRFFIGMSVGGTMLSAYVLVIELSGKSFRPYVIGLEGIAYVISYFVQPIIAYYIREWRHLLLVTSVPWLLIISYYWLIPESPRWLITVGKKKEAIEILTFIAKKNNLNTDYIEDHVMGNEVESQNKEKRGTYLDLFRTRRMRMYTIINACIWLCCSHTFFGINQYIGRLAGNLYLNVMLSAACLTPETKDITLLNTIEQAEQSGEFERSVDQGIDEPPHRKY